MSRQHHYLKTETEYYQLQEDGKKIFEVRKNDRGFKVYDIVYLEEVVKGVKTGRISSPKEIVYILEGGKYGIEEGFCIIQLR